MPPEVHSSRWALSFLRATQSWQKAARLSPATVHPSQTENRPACGWIRSQEEHSTSGLASALAHSVGTMERLGVLGVLLGVPQDWQEMLLWASMQEKHVVTWHLEHLAFGVHHVCSKEREVN